MSWGGRWRGSRGNPQPRPPRDEGAALPGLIFLFLFPFFACQPQPAESDANPFSLYHYPHFSEAKGNGSPLFLTALQF